MIARPRRTVTGAASPLSLRLWPLAIIAGAVFCSGVIFPAIDSSLMATAAAVAILLIGIPHGTLDIEIAVMRLSRSDARTRSVVLATYLACAGTMAICWLVAPALALALFLAVSIVHFGRDWRGGAPPLLATMVGAATIGLPALAHPAEVAAIFNLLAGDRGGSMLTALLAAAAIPSAVGAVVYVWMAWSAGYIRRAVEAAITIAAAILLPPPVGFAVFFCLLHAPRHMADALRETAALSSSKQAAIIAAVSALSLAGGVLLFLAHPDGATEPGVVRTAFMLIAILTMPHFALEQLNAEWLRNRLGDKR